MVAFNFSVPIYAYDQWTGIPSGNPTTGFPQNTTFSLNTGAVLTTIDVVDDDRNPAGDPGGLNRFDDGFIDVPGDPNLNPSTANNDQLLSQAVTINGTTYAADSQVELEFAFTTTTSETFWVIRIAGQNVGISGPTLPEPGTTYQVASSADGQSVPPSSIPCFLSGTWITTKEGQSRIEELSVGDPVLTKHHGYQPIRWIGQRILDEFDLAMNAKLQPIKIQACALGDGAPSTDLLVSPQHRVLVSSKIAQRMFATQEVLVAAKSLLELPGVEIAVLDGPISYFHILLNGHEVVFANDAPTESLLAGPEALKSLPTDYLKELLAIFPEAVFSECGAAPAAFIPKGRQQRRLISRHIKNGRSLVT